MLQLLSRASSQHTVPLNIVRKNHRTQIFVGIPRSLTLGEIKRVLRYCAKCSAERQVECVGTVIDGFTPQGQIAPRFVVHLSAWQCQEKALTEELLAALPGLLRAPVVPVVRH